MIINTHAAALCAQGLQKSYGRQQVLHDLQLELRPSLIYGLIGRNGAGKTTLLSLLTGQRPADGGSVTYGGQPVWENRLALQYLCFLPELAAGKNNARAAMRVRDYLQAGALFYPRWDQAYAQRLLELFALEPKKQVAQLSRGQQSMVNILISLASRAPVTLLDEPTAGLDVVAREDFYRLLLQDHAETGRTFVISTHIIEEAAGVFAQVIFLDQGRILENTPTDRLLEQFRFLLCGAEGEAAAQAAGAAVVARQALGRQNILTLRAKAPTFDRLEQQGFALEPLSLQNVFVALCGHSGKEATP